MAGHLKISAFVLAAQIDIKKIKSFRKEKPVAESSSELLFVTEGDKYQYYFNYGVIVFCGFQEQEMTAALEAAQPYTRTRLTHPIRDDLDVVIQEGEAINISFDTVTLSSVDVNAIRILMFNLAQSVAIDYYTSVTGLILDDVKGIASQMARTGKLRMSRKNMMRFLGKSLNTNNDIAENIYIFDAPELVWNNEFLDKLHQGLIRHFDLRMRFSELEYMLRIIDNNLKVFADINMQRESSLLEWIIIILILVEVFDLFISKLFT